MFLFTVWLLLFFRYLSVPGFNLDFAFIFSCIFAVAHAGEFALAAWLVMLIFLFLPKRLWGAFCVLLGMGVTLFLLVNFFVYRQFRLHLDMAMLGMFFGEAGSDIFVFPTVMYVQAVLGGLAVFVFVGGSWAAAQRLARRRMGKRLKTACLLIFVCILSFHGIHAWARFNLYAPVTAQISVLPLAQPLSLNSALKTFGLKPAAEPPRFSAGTLNYPLGELRFNKPDEFLNLVVIMIDAWRFDMMSEEISPNIHEFSRLAQRFHQHNSASNHTRHGVFSFFYGLPGPYWDAVLVDRRSPALMDALLDSGYSAGVFGSSSLSSPEFDQTVFVKVKGVDRFTAGASPEARDLEITNKFLRFMDERDKSAPFFSFLFYDVPHGYSYDPEISPPKFLPECAKNYLDVGDRQKTLEVFNRYKNSVRYADALVKRVLERLRNENLLENTVVIVTADHGEDFDDLGLGYSGHNGNFSRYQTRVPMLVYWPGREAADYDYETSHLDVAPTLLRELFGCLNPAGDYSVGLDLFDPGPRRYAFMAGPSGSYGIQTGDYITVFPPAGPGYTVSAQDYRPVEWKMPLALYKSILHDLSRFKK